MSPPAQAQVRCPEDGTLLQLVEPGSAQDAPWLCLECSRAWWPAELTPAARAAWSTDARDFLGPRGADVKVARARDFQDQLRTFSDRAKGVR